METEMVSLEGGKYRVVSDDDGRVFALRHGAHWRDLTGDKLVLALVHEAQQAAVARGASSKLIVRLDASALEAALREILPPMADIVEERRRQDARWGGPGHDDSHAGYDWVDFIQHQLFRAALPLGSGSFRDRMVKIAALAVAAIQSYDRVNTPSDADHGS